MPISNDCLSLLNHLIENYAKEGERDKDFAKIHPLLLELHDEIVLNLSAYKDDRVISFFSSSALVLSHNRQFHRCCKNFLLSYQQQTHALDSLLDETLEIKSNLDWNEDSAASLRPAPSTRFFKELMEAVEARQERVELFGIKTL